MLLLIVAIVVIILMNHRKKCVQETIVTFSAPFDVQSGGVVKVDIIIVPIRARPHKIV